MEAWQSVLIAMGGNAAMLAVLGVISKLLLEKLIARDTAKFASDLKVSADTAIEHLKSELQLRTIEHQVRFSRLNERRAVVIAELNGYLAEAVWAADSFFSPFESGAENEKLTKYAVTHNKFIDLFRYYDKNKIFMPASLCSSLEALVTDIRSLVAKYGAYLQVEQALPEQGTTAARLRAWQEGWKAIEERIPLARQTLENEFRSLLDGTANPSIQSRGRDPASRVTPLI